MKGIIFREFLNMVEDRFDDEMVDTIITLSNLPSEGAYTSVGTYHYKELVSLITHLSLQSKMQIPDLMRAFGEYAFVRFTNAYSRMFEGVNDGFTFLSMVEDTIHIEVLKLYPEAELPTLDVKIDNDCLTLIYKSSRRMSDFAEGLILGCLSHFNEKTSLSKKLIKEDGSVVEFTITRN